MDGRELVNFKSMLDFDGKVVVVSGGLGLIGVEVCLSLLQHNATVVVADLDKGAFEAKFIVKESKDKVDFFRLDISSPESIESGIETIAENYKKIDVWVNCGFPRTADWGKFVDDIEFDDWNDNVRMHLGGYFWASKRILEHMKVHRAGSLINFGSIYGVSGPNFSIYEGTSMTLAAAYSAIKGGVVNFSKYFATLYGPYNIRVNSVNPGGVFDHQDATFVERYNNQTPLGRMAKAHEIAMPVLFLASDAASYITVHTLMVDGGWTAW